MQYTVYRLVDGWRERGDYFLTKQEFLNSIQKKLRWHISKEEIGRILEKYDNYFESNIDKSEEQLVLECGSVDLIVDEIIFENGGKKFIKTHFRFSLLTKIYLSNAFLILILLTMNYFFITLPIKDLAKPQGQEISLISKIVFLCPVEKMGSTFNIIISTSILFFWTLAVIAVVYIIKTGIILIPNLISNVVAAVYLTSIMRILKNLSSVNDFTKRVNSQFTILLWGFTISIICVLVVFFVLRRANK